MPQRARAQARREPREAGVAGRIPSFDRSADLMKVAGNATRLKLLYLLDNMNELCVPDLAEMVGVSVSTVSQHLRELKAQGLVSRRRGAHTVYYGLSVNRFNTLLKKNFFQQFEVDRSVRDAGDPAPTVTLLELHDPGTGRLDAARIADYLDVPLKKLSEALGKNYTTVHKTPSAPSLQPGLRPIKRSIEILEEVFGERSSALAWWNNPLPDLGGRAPLEVLLEGHGDAVHDLLEGALVGTPS